MGLECNLGAIVRPDVVLVSERSLKSHSSETYNIETISEDPSKVQRVKAIHRCKLTDFSNATGGAYGLNYTAIVLREKLVLNNNVVAASATDKPVKKGEQVTIVAMKSDMSTTKTTVPVTSCPEGSVEGIVCFQLRDRSTPGKSSSQLSHQIPNNQLLTLLRSCPSIGSNFYKA